MSKLTFILLKIYSTNPNEKRCIYCRFYGYIPEIKQWFDLDFNNFLNSLFSLENVSIVTYIQYIQNCLLIRSLLSKNFYVTRIYFYYP